MAKESLTVQYTKLLQQHRDPDAKAVLDFVKKHKNDKVFIKRVKTLNKLWELKNVI